MKAYILLITSSILIFPHFSFACSKLLNNLVYNTVKPVVEEADLCKGLKKGSIGVDKTDKVKLSGFEYCANALTSYLKANITVKCKTSSKAFLQASFEEKVKIKAEVDNKSCTVTNFEASPTGEVGKAIANNSSFRNDVKKAFQKNIKSLCGD